MQQNATVISFDNANNWVILSPIELSIKKKIETVGVPLKDWDINIYRGILTGYNDAFIISTEKRNEILANCLTEDERQRTKELIRPILRGRDIKRYGYDWANLWIIATFPARKYDIEKYPAVKQYLLSFAEEDLREAGYDWVADNYLSDFCFQKLAQTGQYVVIQGKRIRLSSKDEKSRKRTSNKWFETQDSISYWDDFSQPKIVYPNMTKFLPFVFDDNGYLTNQKCFIITGKNIAFLAAFLNSSLFKYCFKNNFPQLLDETRELSKVFFEKISILEVSDGIEKQFCKIVKDIQLEYADDKAVKIDQIIFDLYNLTDEEKAAIGYIEIQ